MTASIPAPPSILNLDAYPKRDCPACGFTFIVINPRVVYCSKQCKWRTHKRTARHPDKPRADIVAEYEGKCAECKRVPWDFLPPWDGFFVRDGRPLCGGCNSKLSIAMFRIRVPTAGKHYAKRTYQAKRIAEEASEVAEATAPRADSVITSVGQAGL